MEDFKTTEIRIIERSFNVNGHYHDLVFSKEGAIFTISVKNTNGRLCFHEQEVAEQMNVRNPTLDHLIEFLQVYYTTGLNLKRSRDFQIKLLVEGCPQLFAMVHLSLLA